MPEIAHVEMRSENLAIMGCRFAHEESFRILKPSYVSLVLYIAATWRQTGPEHAGWLMLVGCWVVLVF